MAQPTRAQNNNARPLNPEKLASKKAKSMVHRECVGCSKTGALSEMRFMECVQCKSIYCSAECQRQHWPIHKASCVHPSRAEASQRKALAYLISNPILSQHIKILTILHLKLHQLSPEEYAAYVADPFEVEILLNIEPADILNFLQLYHPSAQAETVSSPMRGMIQLLHISNTPEEKSALTAEERREWQRAVRERNKEKSQSQSESESAPQRESVCGFINVNMMIKGSLEGNRRSSVSKCEFNSPFLDYVRNDQPFITPLFRGAGLLINTPMDAFSYMEYINTLIRSDEHNEWSLHTKMSGHDKDIYRFAASPLADPTTNLVGSLLSRLITKVFVEHVRAKVERERIYYLAAVAAGFSLDALYRGPAIEAMTLRVEADRNRVEGKTAVVRVPEHPIN
ncbi:hypothetical protein JR316_0009711 [Psilocybe cubensis]|uniref:MYND-type domain-containing protein n=2 Tax=Psilocybe cubensis TaxID=181762 RepID=A0A8H7XQE9_PSICU|nr:hypothetical protein JR316_0009711 [Psilocybe cubensis]KAH9477494.1 hypothetical protein JR316_0009711 [Psilocybe cubensis]